ncbi:hypothetical protein ACWN8B_00110 [Vagococcus zengguangii]|uniref:Legume lectin domain-containing protein n=1 Tax=Vagococcus zengguangii TaxID=2571750 RepID=A0A4D7CT25_9ENTE|nr:hypothetical protein [Vagococcus zengguangii]QCI86323.1 hypothetical protein FA707_04800 [Vagococcus zengguangii]
MKKLLGTLISLTFFYLLTIPTITHADEVPPHMRLDNIFTVDLGQSENIAGVTDDGTVYITTAGYSQIGAIWSTDNNLLDFKEPFEIVAYTNQGLGMVSDGKQKADGMAFVIRSTLPITDGAYEWFSHSGSSLGVYADEGYGKSKNGIANSIAIEYDLYKNIGAPDAFDQDLTTVGDKGSHIATAFPNDPSTYDDRYVLPILGKSYRVMKHENVLNSVPIQTDKWIKLEVKWQPSEDKDISKGQLSYTIDNNTFIIDSKRFFKQVFGSQNEIQTAYFGFTGSTGPSNTAGQAVVFEQIPSVVNSNVNTTIKKADNSEVVDGETIVAGETLTVEVTPEWVGGNQNWSDIATEINLPAKGVSLVANSTKLNGEDLSDDYWQNGILNLPEGTLPDLGIFEGNGGESATIQFQLKVANNDDTGKKIVSSSFTGSNNISKSESVGFLTENKDIILEITNPKEGDIFVDDGQTELSFDVKWKTNVSNPPLKGKFQIVQDDNVYDISDMDINGSGQGSVNWIKQFKEIGFGKFKAVFSVTDDNVNESVSVNLIKQDRPILKVLRLENEEVAPNSEILVNFEVQDRDSTAGDLWMKLDDGEFSLVDSYSDFNAVGPKLLDTTLNTTGLSNGAHVATYYFVDPDGNQSNESALNFTVSGKLEMVDKPTDFKLTDIALGDPDTKVDMGKIGLSDGRLDKTSWKLSVAYSEPFSTTVEGTQLIAPDGFLYYSKDGVKHNVNTTGTILLEDTTIPDNETLYVDQEDSNGFYIHTNYGMRTGEYNGTLLWSLEMTP